MKFMLALMAAVAATEETFSDEVATQAGAVGVLRNDLSYGDWTFANFEELEANIDEWAEKITVHDLYRSDFYEVGTADGMRDALGDDEGVELIYVEPCEMFVIQVTLPWDFSNNWLVENNFELNDFGFVDAFDIDSDTDEERFRGAYAIRFPCDDYPGQTYKSQEYGKYALHVKQQYLDSGSGPYWRREIAFEFEVADAEKFENDGNAMFVILGIIVVIGAAFFFLQ